MVVADKCYITGPLQIFVAYPCSNSTLTQWQYTVSALPQFISLHVICGTDNNLTSTRLCFQFFGVSGVWGRGIVFMELLIANLMWRVLIRLGAEWLEGWGSFLFTIIQHHPYCWCRPELYNSPQLGCRKPLLVHTQSACLIPDSFI